MRPLRSSTRRRSSRDAVLMLTVDEAAQRLRVGRSTLFRLIATGDLASVKIGKSRRVPVAALDAFVARLIADGDDA